MIKTLTINDIQAIGQTFFPVWNSNQSAIKLPARSMYRLIALKKVFEAEITKIQEAVAKIAEDHGGVQKETGGYDIPDDKIAETNEALLELSKETVDIEYQPIMIDSTTELPSAIIEVLFDFLEVVE